MLSHQQYRRAGQGQHLRAQQSKLAVTCNRDSSICGDRSAFQYSAGGSQRFDENGALVRNVVGKEMEISFGQSQKLCVCAIAAGYPEHSPLRTMARITRAAEITTPATGIDFADNTAASLQTRHKIGRNAAPGI